jgi:hypothetical protein
MKTEIIPAQRACSLYAWGTRQSISTPGQPFQVYGGSTACYGLFWDGSATIVMEAGFGLRYVPASVWEGSNQVVVSSVHWDKIQGIPFTPSVYNPKLSFRIIGPNLPDREFAEALLDQQRPELCPVPNFYQDGIGATVRVEGFTPTVDWQCPVEALNFSICGDGSSCTQMEFLDRSLAYFPSGIQDVSTTEADTILLGMPPRLQRGQEELWLQGCTEFLARNVSVRRVLVCNYLPWQDDASLNALQLRLGDLIDCQFLQQGCVVELGAKEKLRQ